MFTAGELEELKKSVKDRTNALEEILKNCGTDYRQSDVVTRKLVTADRLIEKIDKIIDDERYVPIKRVFRFGENL